jgi:3'-phosphoadenosine 5'-phosphosulfate sulfotransferase (PAPS reductase)/FAD synthetase
MSDVIIILLAVIPTAFFLDFLLKVKETIQFKREMEREWDKFIEEDNLL